MTLTAVNGSGSLSAHPGGVIAVAMLGLLGREAWGADLGRTAAEKLDRMLRDRPERIANLHFRGVDRIDVSCAREAVVVSIRRQRGERCFFLSGIPSSNPGVRENLSAALALAESTVLLRGGGAGGCELIGHPVSPVLVQTLGVVDDLGSATARQVAREIRGLELSACHNRLRDLCNAGLLVRVGSSSSVRGARYVPVR